MGVKFSHRDYKFGTGHSAKGSGNGTAPTAHNHYTMEEQKSEQKAKGASFPLGEYSFALSTGRQASKRENRNGTINFGLPMAEIVFQVPGIPGAIHRATIWQNWVSQKGDKAGEQPAVDVLGRTVRKGVDYTLSFSLPFYPPRDARLSGKAEACAAVLESYKESVIVAYEQWRDKLADNVGNTNPTAKPTPGRLVRTAA